MNPKFFLEAMGQLDDGIIMEVASAMGHFEDRHHKRKITTAFLIAAIVATLAVTAYAAAAHFLRTEPVGELAVLVSAGEETEDTGTVRFSGEGAAPVYQGLNLTPGWLPEGMRKNEDGKWGYADYSGGFTLISWVLDAGNATFCELVPDTESQTAITIADHSAVYLKLYGDGSYNQRMYISYPEYNAVLSIFISSDVRFDDAVRFAENLNVTAGDSSIHSSTVEYHGQLYQAAANRTNAVDPATESSTPADRNGFRPYAPTPSQKAAAENMVNAKKVGETYHIQNVDSTPGRVLDLELPITVTDVQISENIRILRDPQYLKNNVRECLDEQGNLKRDKLRFFTYGNGIDAHLSTVVAEMEQQPKLAAITFEITNDTQETILNAGFLPRLLTVEETPEGWREYRPQPDNSAAFRDFSGEHWESLDSMCYFDVFDHDSNGGNHIRNLAPGETISIQVAFLVNECQADHLWFWFTVGDINTISEGYVPLRP